MHQFLWKVPTPKIIGFCTTMAEQDKIFRRKRLSTGANFFHVYLEI